VLVWFMGNTFVSIVFELFKTAGGVEHHSIIGKSNQGMCRYVVSGGDPL